MSNDKKQEKMQVFEVKESENVSHFLKKKRNSQGRLVWVLWSEFKGIICGDVVVKNRLDKKTQEWFGVK